MRKSRSNIILIIIETLLIFMAGIFSNQISNSIHLSLNLTVFSFAFLMITLLIVQVFRSSPLFFSPSKSTPSSEARMSNGFLKHLLYSVSFTDSIFPLGLVTGFLSSIPIIILTPHFENPQAFSLLGVRPYELFCAIWGIAILLSLRLFNQYHNMNFLALGYGLGQAAAVLSFAPFENDPLQTFIFTPLLFLAISLSLHAGPRRWRYLLSLPCFFLLLLLTPNLLSWIVYGSFSSELSHQSGSVELYAVGSRSVYYQHLYKSPPFLDVRLSSLEPDSVKFNIVNQDTSHFEVVLISSYRFPVVLLFDAMGKERDY